MIGRIEGVVRSRVFGLGEGEVGPAVVFLERAGAVQITAFQAEMALGGGEAPAPAV